MEQEHIGEQSDQVDQDPGGASGGEPECCGQHGEAQVGDTWHHEPKYRDTI
jgi:hypothetical protein